MEGTVAILNEINQVVAIFHGSGGLKELEEPLRRLKQRNEELGGGPVELIYVDNCRTVAGFLERLFVGAKVKEDLFHVLQRMRDTLPHGHPLADPFMKEYTAACKVRDPSDEKKAREVYGVEPSDSNCRSYIPRPEGYNTSPELAVHIMSLFLGRWNRDQSFKHGDADYGMYDYDLLQRVNDLARRLGHAVRYPEADVKLASVEEKMHFEWKHLQPADDYGTALQLLSRRDVQRTLLPLITGGDSKQREAAALHQLVDEGWWLEFPDQVSRIRNCTHKGEVILHGPLRWCLGSQDHVQRDTAAAQQGDATVTLQPQQQQPQWAEQQPQWAQGRPPWDQQQLQMGQQHAPLLGLQGSQSMGPLSQQCSSQLQGRQPPPGEQHAPLFGLRGSQSMGLSSHHSSSQLQGRQPPLGEQHAPLFGLRGSQPMGPPSHHSSSQLQGRQPPPGEQHAPLLGLRGSQSMGPLSQQCSSQLQGRQPPPGEQHAPLLGLRGSQSMGPPSHHSSSQLQGRQPPPGEQHVPLLGLQGSQSMGPPSHHSSSQLQGRQPPPGEQHVPLLGLQGSQSMGPPSHHSSSQLQGRQPPLGEQHAPLLGLQGSQPMGPPSHHSSSQLQGRQPPLGEQHAALLGLRGSQSMGLSSHHSSSQLQGRQPPPGEQHAPLLGLQGSQSMGPLSQQCSSQLQGRQPPLGEQHAALFGLRGSQPMGPLSQQYSSQLQGWPTPPVPSLSQQLGSQALSPDFGSADFDCDMDGEDPDQDLRSLFSVPANWAATSAAWHTAWALTAGGEGAVGGAARAPQAAAGVLQAPSAVGSMVQTLELAGGALQAPPAVMGTMTLEAAAPPAGAPAAATDGIVQGQPSATEEVQVPRVSGGAVQAAADGVVQPPQSAGLAALMSGAAQPQPKFVRPKGSRMTGQYFSGERTGTGKGGKGTVKTCKACTARTGKVVLKAGHSCPFKDDAQEKAPKKPKVN
ncbi:hypothetical protein PLESTF_000318800 [Pleodorina starrii]|nr:hypothetical protein PLESTF_000318800 [Pleodorina starrii]